MPLPLPSVSFSYLFEVQNMQYYQMQGTRTVVLLVLIVCTLGAKVIFIGGPSAAILPIDCTADP